MSIIDSIKSLFGGQVEVKASEALESIINTVKPLLEKVDSNNGIASAIENYGDIGDKLKEVVGKLSSAASSEKASLTAEKNDIVASLTEKGKALLTSLQDNEAVPEQLKGLCQKAEALLSKLG